MAQDKTSLVQDWAVPAGFVLIFLILAGTFVCGCMEPTLPNTPQPTQAQQMPQGYECTITDYGNNVLSFNCPVMAGNTAAFSRSLSRYLSETNASVVGITSSSMESDMYTVVVKR
ncbi:MAG: hypothetical protein M0Q91_13865 [Methanoregula sp.]|jgi:hypothetical protein|nr:hypothetical protein [Methanoregula sp.]